jgi:hypothetical protein
MIFYGNNILMAGVPGSDKIPDFWRNIMHARNFAE